MVTRSNYRAARSRALSPALARQLNHLETLLPPTQLWAKLGMPLDRSPQIRKLITQARSHIKARRFLSAKLACDAAQALYDYCAPTIRDARLRRDAERGARAVANLHADGTQARQDSRAEEKAIARAQYGALVKREKRRIPAAEAARILASAHGRRRARTIRKYLTEE